MSWIKKLFHMFKTDDDEYENIEEYDEERGHENIQPPKSSKESSRESSRDVDAKVVYQYPKGQFRFPVIPDGEGESEKRRPRPRPRPVEKQEAPARKPKKRQPRSVEREHQKKPAPPAAREEKILTRNEREAVNKKRPFQPTEIPSPIYGFERRNSGASKNKSETETNEFKPKELTYDEIMRKIQQRPPRKPKSTAENVNQEEKGDTISDKIEAFHTQAAAPETEEHTVNKYTIGEASDLMFEIPEEDGAPKHHSETNQPSGAELQEDLSNQGEPELINDEGARFEPASKNKNSAKTNISDLLEYALLEEAASKVQENKQEITVEVSKPRRENHHASLASEDEVNVPTEVQTDTDLSDISFKEEVQAQSNETGHNHEGINHFNSSMDEPSWEAKQAEEDELKPEDLELTSEIEEITHKPESSERLQQESEAIEEVQEKPEMAEEVLHGTEAFGEEQPVSGIIPKEQPEPEIIEEAKPEQLEEFELPEDPIIETISASSELEQAASNTVHPVQSAASEQNESKEQERETASSDSLKTEPDAEDGSSNEGQQEKKPSTRGTIPFNVIMLNNDRKKLNQQREIAKPAVSQNKPAEEQQKKSNITRFPLESIQQSAAAVEQAEDQSNVHAETTRQAEERSSQAFEDKQPEGTTLQEEDEISYYEFPSKTLLTPPVIKEETSDWLYEQEQMLNSTLKNFNVRARVVNVTQGPSVTRFEVQPEPGVKVNKITNLSDDIKLSLAARDIRIEAPIPGKHTIGIEVPNQSSRPVFISEIINTPEFQNSESPLTAVLGLDISGKPIVTDLRKMPHGLIAGATGSGKSVCINTILVSLLYKASPEELKLLLVDPKMVELAPYNRIPHLVSPVITDVKAATAALKWAVEEMERRYELFAHAGVRDINRFNELAEEHKRYSEKLPFMVIVIDELADLMMMSPADVEEAICRIAQKARACGIHLIIATQRPSVDVITGLIKANVPTRIAFSVSSQIDSRTIIDISGAEKLLGRGDMLFLENGTSKPVRLQGTFVSDKEIDDVVAHVRRERDPDYLFEQEELLKKAQVVEEEDELFLEACEFVVDQGGASTSSLQRRFKIGYNRAARLIDMMEKQGFISENRGSKPRDVLITEADLESIQDTSTLN
ncbi:DNA translocase FtsK [Aeromicrobium ponti]|uniref:S-DNA-T family DNA segregation ATPase FtsK/SpoIIIE n=1 Tax=Cytobacillus oceanisediminis TaxID=665099 RepID=A0A562JMQ5_9BACI|nr:S-DNA-T family DNA segregation ATPase FtsK/SpoIIIE [Cytobacillus oceanisediminis]